MLLTIVLVLIVARIAGLISVKLGQPAVLGQLLTGLVLGPTVLGWVHHSNSLSDMAEIGVILLMFIAGLETDLSAIRSVGLRSLAIAAGGVLVPLAGGAYYSLRTGADIWTALFVGTVLTATSVSISAQTLMDLGFLRSEEGAAIMGAAVIDDILGILVLTVVVSVAKGQAGSSVLHTFGGLVLFLGAVVLIAPRLLPPLIRYADRHNGSEMLLSTALIVCFLLAWSAELVGVADITGAYIAGILFARTEARRRVSGRTQVLAYSLFTPLFFAGIGVNAQLRGLSVSLASLTVLIVLSVASKVIGCGAAAIMTGYTSTEALRIGVGMIPRGEVALITASIGLDAGLLTGDIYASMVIAVLATTVLTPPLLQAVFRRKTAGCQTITM